MPASACGNLDRVGTAGVEIAAAGRSRGVRHLPLQHDAPRACARVRLGNGGEKRRRVRVLGSLEELVGRRQLHEAPDVHHGHAVADVSHDAQVVRHEEIRQPKLGLQIEQEIQDLGLHRHVQGRDGLIGNHQARVQGQRPGDADALSLASAEGVREAAHVLGPEPDAAQEIRHVRLTLVAILHAVHQQRLPDEIEQGHARIERGERILEDHLHLSTQRAQLRRAQPAHLDHRASGDPHEDLAPRRLDGPQDAPRRRGLSAAALADQAQRLPLVDVKVDAVHRPDVAHRPLPEALPDRKELLQPGDPQQGLLGQGGRPRDPGLAGHPRDRRRTAHS